MNEVKINAMFQSLQSQNQQLSAQLTEAHGIIAEMEAYLKEQQASDSAEDSNTLEETE